MFDKKNQWKAWVFLSPAIVLLLIFTVWPIINTLIIAFQNGYDSLVLARITQEMKQAFKALDALENLSLIEYIKGAWSILQDFMRTYSIEFPWGIDNFKTVFQNEQFAISMRNTIFLCFLTVPLSTFLALLIAVCLNSIKPLQRLLQTIFFLPYVTNSIAIGLVFSAMFNVIGSGNIVSSVGVVNNVIGYIVGAVRTTGFLDLGFVVNALTAVKEWSLELNAWAIDFSVGNLVNGILGSIVNGARLSGSAFELVDMLGFFQFTSTIVKMFAQMLNDISRLLLGEIEYIKWISAGSKDWANYAVLIVYIVWNALPFKILVLLGGLQSINKQYYDAAKIDATPRRRVFTKITVPLLSPMIAYVLITGFIGGFKEYSSVVAIFDENMGSQGSLYTMVGLIYDYIGGNATQYGVASAAALVLFVIIFIVTLINLNVSKKKTHY